MMKNNKGFTLIELIVVIAILGILSAIAVPRISGFTQTAKISADESNVKLLHNSIQMYEAQTGNYPVGAAATDATDAKIAEVVALLVAEDILPDDTVITKESNGTIAFTSETIDSTEYITGCTYTPAS